MMQTLQHILMPSCKIFYSCCEEGLHVEHPLLPKCPASISGNVQFSFLVMLKLGLTRSHCELWVSWKYLLIINIFGLQEINSIVYQYKCSQKAVTLPRRPDSLLKVVGADFSQSKHCGNVAKKKGVTLAIKIILHKKFTVSDLEKNYKSEVH